MNVQRNSIRVEKPQGKIADDDHKVGNLSMEPSRLQAQGEKSHCRLLNLQRFQLSDGSPSILRIDKQARATFHSKLPNFPISLSILQSDLEFRFTRQFGTSARGWLNALGFTDRSMAARFWRTTSHLNFSSNVCFDFPCQQVRPLNAATANRKPVSVVLSRRVPKFARLGPPSVICC